jgi:glycosyltransferase involved in cell wall biosynthesis
MAAGVPVVATAAGAIPEVVGDAAELVAPGDVSALAGALERVISDEALRARLVSAGHARVARFTWAGAAGAMSELYSQAALERRSR